MAEEPIPARTCLFVPGTRPERFAKALASGADVVVLDLEDAVAAGDKEAARRTVGDSFSGAAPADRARIVVRINDAASAWFPGDLLALREAGASSVLLPKAESGQQIAAVKSALPGAKVLALIESARGVVQVDAVAAGGASLARRHGSGAKLCIHSSQVKPIHTALRPSAEAVDRARRVLAADAAAPGAARLDGRMVDRPVVLQAQRTLSLVRD